MTKFKVGDRIKKYYDGKLNFSGEIVLINRPFIDIIRDDGQTGSGIKVNGKYTWHTFSEDAILDRIENWKERIK